MCFKTLDTSQQVTKIPEGWETFEVKFTLDFIYYPERILRPWHDEGEFRRIPVNSLSSGDKVGSAGKIEF